MIKIQLGNILYSASPSLPISILLYDNSNWMEIMTAKNRMFNAYDRMSLWFVVGYLFARKRQLFCVFLQKIVLLSISNDCVFTVHSEYRIE